MPAVTVRVEGLNEFRRHLSALGDKGLTDEFKDVNQNVARLVVERGQNQASTRLERRAAQTLKAVRSGVKALVGLGGAAFRGALGAEFGAARDVPRATARGTVLGWNQFKAWRGAGQNAGYFLHPAIREATDEIVDMYGDGLEAIAAKAFPD